MPSIAAPLNLGSKFGLGFVDLGVLCDLFARSPDISLFINQTWYAFGADASVTLSSGPSPLCKQPALSGWGEYETPICQKIPFGGAGQLPLRL
jgi:hypothetical protein